MDFMDYLGIQIYLGRFASITVTVSYNMTRQNLTLISISDFKTRLLVP